MSESYKNFISALKKKWIGKRVMYSGKIYTVVDVDYNGCLLIDKKAQFTNTTAIDAFMAHAVAAV